VVKSWVPARRFAYGRRYTWNEGHLHWRFTNNTRRPEHRRLATRDAELINRFSKRSPTLYGSATGADREKLHANEDAPTSRTEMGKRIAAVAMQQESVNFLRSGPPPRGTPKGRFWPRDKPPAEGFKHARGWMSAKSWRSKLISTDPRRGLHRLRSTLRSTPDSINPTDLGGENEAPREPRSFISRTL